MQAGALAWGDPREEGTAVTDRGAWQATVSRVTESDTAEAA